MSDMATKLSLLILFFAVMVGIGLYCRRHASDVAGFVLGGRSVGPWLTAFAYGTSYFSAVVFVGYAGQFGWRYGIAATWAGLGNAFLGSLLAWVVLGRRTRSNDPASGQRHHAGVLRQALRLQGAEDRRVHHRLYLPHPLHGLALQRPFPAVRPWPSTSTTRSVSSSWRR